MKKIAVVVLIVGILLVGICILRDKVEVINHELKEMVHPSEDVVNHFGQLSVNGFEWLADDIRWIDESTIHFQGRRDGQDSLSYTFDTTTLELVEVISDSKDDAINTLAFLEGQSSKMPSIEKFSSDDAIIVSKNEDKIGFLDHELATYRTYDVSSGKYRTMQFQQGRIENLDALEIKLSDDGGFISFSEENADLKKSVFSIVGADSGRYYGKDIKGIGPVFSPNSKTLAFIYSGDLQNDYIGGKIGLFILKHKKIVYLDSLLSNEIVMPYIAWSEDNEYLYFVSEDDKSFYMLNELNVQTGEREGHVLESLVRGQDLGELIIHDGLAYMFFDKGTLLTLDLKNGRSDRYEDLLKFDNESYTKQLMSKKMLVYSEDALCLLSSNGYKIIAEYDGVVQDIYLSGDESKVCLSLKDGDKRSLRISEITE